MRWGKKTWNILYIYNSCTRVAGNWVYGVYVCMSGIGTINDIYSVYYIFTCNRV